jgi:acetyl-CoA acetyltransferase
VSYGQRSVAIVGAAMNKFGRYPDTSVHDLGWPVAKAAMLDAGIGTSLDGRNRIEAVYCGSAFSGRLPGQRVMRSLGMLPVPVTNCENACSSGATALREAWIAVANGIYDTVLVMGIDKLSSNGGGVLPGQDDDADVAVGMSMPVLYAMRARRYMHEHGLRPEQLAKVAVKAHRHGALNPLAQFQNQISLEDVMSARPVADPFTLLHCCPTGDGAAAVVITCADKVKNFSQPPVWIKGSTLTSGIYKPGFRDMTTPEITVRGAELAYEESGVSPSDIDIAEVHDAFTITELLYYEALGFCERGQAIRMLEDGQTSLGGRIPVNPSGGLLSKGHPVGATGIAQLCEITWQLRGTAGKRQVEGARMGLAHCTGGGITGLDHGACTITILNT